MRLLEMLGITTAKPPSDRPLALYNTLSKTKERFVPLRQSAVKMYSCGPTVYDLQHIGNLRPYVFSDILKRTLLYNGFAVRHVINITDVGHLTGDNEGDPDIGEDKVEKRAREEGRKARDITRSVTKIFLNDLEMLNVQTEHIVFTKASDYSAQQIALVRTLEEKEYTYKISDGIYFDTSKFKDYGKLGNIDIGKLQAGARVEENKEKRNPSDFGLWKLSKKPGSRQQEWDSPWGIGFPGWHTECTAMIFAELGKRIDIHTGGIDHIPIHHNNEIAQAEAITGKQYVNYWLHNAFITIEGQKISKSIGNTIYLRHITDRGFVPLSYRYWLLTAHYRTPINFTWEALDGAHTTLTRLHRFFIEELGERNGSVHTPSERAFHEAVNDDLDTPKALAILWDLVHNKQIDKPDKRATLLKFDKILGLGLREGSKRLREMLADEQKRIAVKKAPQEIQDLLTEREQARSEKNWKQADTFRKAIEERGYVVEDTDEGPELKQSSQY